MSINRNPKYDSVDAGTFFGGATIGESGEDVVGAIIDDSAVLPNPDGDPYVVDFDQIIPAQRWLTKVVGGADPTGENLAQGWTYTLQGCDDNGDEIPTALWQLDRDGNVTTTGTATSIGGFAINEFYNGTTLTGGTYAADVGMTSAANIPVFAVNSTYYNQGGTVQAGPPVQRWAWVVENPESTVQGVGSDLALFSYGTAAGVVATAFIRRSDSHWDFGSGANIFATTTVTSYDSSTQPTLGLTLPGGSATFAYKNTNNSNFAAMTLTLTAPTTTTLDEGQMWTITNANAQLAGGVGTGTGNIAIVTPDATTYWIGPGETITLTVEQTGVSTWVIKGVVATSNYVTTLPTTPTTITTPGTYLFTQATAVQYTLIPTGLIPGRDIKFIKTDGTVANAVTVTAGSAVLFGQNDIHVPVSAGTGGGPSPVTGTTATVVASTATKGDYLTFTSLSSSSIFVHSACGAPGGITYA